MRGAARRARRRRRARRARSTRPRSRSCATSRPARSAGSCRRRRSLLRQIANALPAPYRFRPAGDLATEIEWAKNRRIAPGELPSPSLGGHEPPIPRRSDGSASTASTSGARRTAGRDRLRGHARARGPAPRDATSAARATFRDRYRAFTVDEYQDVNLLQQTLLERWLGDRDDLCVVGDDDQTIYASPARRREYLLGVQQRFPRRDRRAARAELPLDAAGARAREPARAAARRRREGAARDAARRPGAGRARVRDRRGRGALARRRA